MFVAAVLAFIYVSYASPSFLTPGNIFNVFRNFAFVGIIAPRHDRGHHHRRHRPFGRLGPLPDRHGHRHDDGGRLFDLGRAARRRSAPRRSPAAISGVLIAYVGMPPFVVTLGMMSLARSLAMVMSNNTMVFDFGRDHAKFIGLGGGSTRGWFTQLADMGRAGHRARRGCSPGSACIIVVPNPAVFLGVFALLFGFAFRWTKWGRHIFAIGGNEQAAVMTGVPVRSIKVSVYMLSALVAGIAGILQVGWLGTITTGMGTGMELIVIAAVVIGGANLMGGSGTAFGAVVGAALIEIIRNSLTLLGINPFWQGTFVGTFIIVAVLFDRIRHNRDNLADALAIRQGDARRAGRLGAA